MRAIFLERLQPLGLLGLRLAVGVIMVAHGYKKLFGGGVHSLMGSIAGWGWPWWLAYMVTYLEFAGGMLLIVGLLTRLLGLGYTIEMAVAIWKVHWHNGLMGPGGFEFPLTVAAIAFALVWFGAGPISIDHLIWGGGHRANQ
jgi:putative oxidoreductase